MLAKFCSPALLLPGRYSSAEFHSHTEKLQQLLDRFAEKEAVSFDRLVQPYSQAIEHEHNFFEELWSAFSSSKPVEPGTTAAQTEAHVRKKDSRVNESSSSVGNSSSPDQFSKHATSTRSSKYKERQSPPEMPSVAGPIST